ncbi:MAG: hypothetical protein ACREGJ_04920 [Candidatus Saccharimonadales bacterium]
MARKPVPPVMEYEFVDDGDTSAVDEAFNYLFDRYFKELAENPKE